MSSDLKLRRGVLRIRGAFLIENLKVFQLVFSGSVVFKAEHNLMHDEMEYHLVHPEFRLLDENEISPTYDISIDTDEDTGEVSRVNFHERK